MKVFDKNPYKVKQVIESLRVKIL